MATLHFTGKEEIWNYHEEVPTKELNRIPELDYQPQKGGGNMIIEGDNLYALKSLISDYSGQVKMIYIDPPYNTGKDFVYSDNISKPPFTDWMNKVVKKKDMDRHDKWLCMMTPRLFLAKELLREDGVIFISIDDNEVHHLRKLCDEVFGEENFVANVVWEQGKKSLASKIATNHEYCIVFAKNSSEHENYIKNRSNITEYNYWSDEKDGVAELLILFEKWKASNPKVEQLQLLLDDFWRGKKKPDPIYSSRHYKHVDEKGIYFGSDISQGTGNGGRFEILHPITSKPVKLPEGGWRFSKKNLPKYLEEGKIMFGEDHTTVPKLKRYLVETTTETANSVFYKDGRGATKRLKSLFEKKKIFDFPKDEFIIARYISWVSSRFDYDDIILDFFAGSGTTAQAVMEQNAKDGGNRRYILVQLPEPTPEKSAARKAGYEHITQITRERVVRAIDKHEFDSGFTYHRIE